VLLELRIENLLLIERAELRFGGGLNVITGETGAGKTVLAHSLDLLLGGRPRSAIVRPGAEEAWVEGSFELPDELRMEPELSDLAERLPPGEVHEHGWAQPVDLLAEVAAGRRTALPPTRAVLTRLARAVMSLERSPQGRRGGATGGPSAVEVAAVLLREAVLVPVVPRATWREGDDTPDDAVRGVDLLLPGHAGEVP